MGIVATVLLALAVLVLLVAEWPRLAERLGRAERPRRMRRPRRHLTVVEGGEEDDFAASVQRDLANLPTVEERDEGSRR